MTTTLAKLKALSPTAFENLVFDLVVTRGFQRVVWRTPGADGGRDIEAVSVTNDLAGHLLSQAWHIECKRYASSIDWPTLHQKLAYADNRSVDFLLLATTANPSAPCESEITLWNNGRHPTKIRVWRGYEMERLILSAPVVAAKYGIIQQLAAQNASLLALTTELTHLSQAAYVSHSLGMDPEAPLAVAAAVSELIALCMDHLRAQGRVTSAPRADAAPTYDWLRCSGAVDLWPDAGLRALLSAVRYASGASELVADFTADSALITPVTPRISLSLAPLRLVEEIAMWSDIEVDVNGDGTLSARARQ